MNVTQETTNLRKKINFIAKGEKFKIDEKIRTKESYTQVLMVSYFTNISSWSMGASSLLVRSSPHTLTSM